jgi:hypothetical protein
MHYALLSILLLHQNIAMFMEVCQMIYFLQSILSFTNTDVSRTKICLDVSVFVKYNMDVSVLNLLILSGLCICRLEAINHYLFSWYTYLMLLWYNFYYNLEGLE